MKLTKCEQCGGPTAEGLPLCPDCMRATGAAADQIAAAEDEEEPDENQTTTFDAEAAEDTE